MIPLFSVRVLFVVMDAGRGGHTRTAITIAEALESRGHRVTFAIGRDSYNGIITDAGFEALRVTYSGPNSLRRLIHRLHRKGKLDAVHSFSIRGLAEAQIAGSELGIPCLYTRCGGPPHGLFTVLSVIRPPVVASLSAELVPELARTVRRSEHNIKVLPARVNLKSLEDIALLSGPEIKAFRSKYGIPDDSDVILRIARISPEYMSSIIHTAHATAQLVREGARLTFVHIGVGADQELELSLMDTLRALNQVAGTQVAISVRDEAEHAVRLVSMAKVVVGAGRSAMESLSLGKPTMLVSPRGFSGLVDASSVDSLAYYNFSGRNLAVSMTPQESIDALTHVLRRLLSDPGYYAEVAAASKNYATASLDASVSAKEYERLYREFDTSTYSSTVRLYVAAALRHVYDYAVRRLPEPMLNRVRRLAKRRYLST